MGISGCSTFSSKSPKNVLYENWNANIAQDFVSGKYQDKYNTLSCTIKGEEARQERNRQLERFITGVDSYYYQSRNLLITGKGIQNTFHDIAQLGITGVATFASGGTANILAAIATASQGSKLSFDKNILSEQSAFLIATKMDQLRKTKLNLIAVQKLKGCDNYSLDQAMKDGIDYYYAGTVNGALISIFSETGNKMKKAKEDKREIVVTGTLAK